MVLRRDAGESGPGEERKNLAAVGHEEQEVDCPALHFGAVAPSPIQVARYQPYAALRRTVECQPTKAPVHVEHWRDRFGWWVEPRAHGSEGVGGMHDHLAEGN